MEVWYKEFEVEDRPNDRPPYSEPEAESELLHLISTRINGKPGVLRECLSNVHVNVGGGGPAGPFPPSMITKYLRPARANPRNLQNFYMQPCVMPFFHVQKSLFPGWKCSFSTASNRTETTILITRSFVLKNKLVSQSLFAIVLEQKVLSPECMNHGFTKNNKAYNFQHRITS